MKTKITDIDFSRFPGGELQLRMRDSSEEELFRGRIRKLLSTPPKMKVSLAWLVREFKVVKMSYAGAERVSRFEFASKPYLRNPTEVTNIDKVAAYLMFFRYDIELEIDTGSMEIIEDGSVFFKTVIGESCVLLPANHPDTLDEEILKKT